MDWPVAKEHIRKWFANASGIDAALVAFEREPVGMRSDAWAELAFTPFDTEIGEEVRLTAIEGDEDNLAAEQMGNRSCKLACKVRKRTEPHVTAYGVLSRVRNRLELAAAQEAFEAAGLALRDVLALTETGVSVDSREESEAVLELVFAYSESSADEGEVEIVGRLKGVRYGGRATSGSTVINVPDQEIP